MLLPPQEPHLQQYCHCACPVCMYTRVRKCTVIFSSMLNTGPHSCIWGASNYLAPALSVHRRFTKRLLAYTVFLIQTDLSLHLQSLELHRLVSDLIWCYKIVFGHVDVDIGDGLKIPLSHVHVPEDGYKLYKSHTIGNRSSFFADRTATQYDRLLASSCCPSVCDAVHCGCQRWCTRLKVAPACS